MSQCAPAKKQKKNKIANNLNWIIMLSIYHVILFLHLNRLGLFQLFLFSFPNVCFVSMILTKHLRQNHFCHTILLKSWGNKLTSLKSKCVLTQDTSISFGWFLTGPALTVNWKIRLLEIFFFPFLFFCPCQVNASGQKLFSHTDLHKQNKTLLY